MNKEFINEALILMSQDGYIPVIEYLLNIGADIHVNDDEALFKAVEKGQSETIKYLLLKGANINAKNRSIVPYAVLYRDLDIVRLLVENNADPHVKNDLSMWMAAEFGKYSIVLYLLEQGAVVIPRKDAEEFKKAKKNIPCYSLLSRYSGKTITEIIEILSDKREQTKTASKCNHYTDQINMLRGHFPILGWKKTRDETQMTQEDKNNALNNMIVYGNLEMVIYLRTIGADIYTENHFPLINAIMNSCYDVVRYLIKEGVDIKTPKKNIQAYREAIAGDDIEMVRLLIELGIDFSHNNYAPVRYAIERNSDKIVSFFAEQGIQEISDMIEKGLNSKLSK